MELDQARRKLESGRLRGMQRMHLVLFPNINTLMSLGGISRRLNPHFSFRVRYAFNSSAGYEGPL